MLAFHSWNSRREAHAKKGPFFVGIVGLDSPQDFAILVGESSRVNEIFLTLETGIDRRIGSDCGSDSNLGPKDLFQEGSQCVLASCEFACPRAFV